MPQKYIIKNHLLLYFGLTFSRIGSFPKTEFLFGYYLPNENYSIILKIRNKMAAWKLWLKVNRSNIIITRERIEEGLRIASFIVSGVYIFFLIQYFPFNQKVSLIEGQTSQ